MNSINRNQPEHNHQDLGGTDAIQKIRTVIDKAKTCFFCTVSGNGDSKGVRPMNVRKVDDTGNLWFLLANDSQTHEELSRHPEATLFFQGSPHSDFLHLNGRVTLSRDQAMIEELWEPVLKTWFTEGKNDPRIAVVKLTPTTGYYWDNKHGDAIAGIKMLVGAAVGKTLDDSIEGKIHLGGG